MKKYLLNVLIGVDQLFNTILAGYPDETISSRIGKLKRQHGGIIPWYHPLVGLIDWGLDKIEPGHSIGAIEDDEGEC